MRWSADFPPLWHLHQRQPIRHSIRKGTLDHTQDHQPVSRKSEKLNAGDDNAGLKLIN